MTGTVAWISIAPVKGMRVQGLESVDLTREGVPGDRAFILVDSSGAMVNGKRFGSLMEIVPTHDRAAGRLSLGFPDGRVVEGEVEAGAAGRSVGLQGRCRIGFGELSGLTWLPRLVQKVAELHPDLQLEPHADIGQVLEQRIVDGELDCVVIAGPSSRSSLAFEQVAQVRFVWAASDEFIARAGTGLPRRLVREQLLIALPTGSGATRTLDDWLGRHGLAVERRLSCNSWGAVVGMVVDGLGFTYMPEQWALALQQRGRLRVLDGSAEAAKHSALAPLTYTVQWRRDDARPLITEMREIIRSVIDFPAPRCLS